MFGDSTFNKVLRIVKEWHPAKNYSREAAYRDELLDVIREQLKTKSSFGFPPEKHRVSKESGRYLADIEIDKKIGIELKRNLGSKSELYRLIGQVRHFMKSYDYVIAVLCGDTKEELLDDLQDEAKELSTYSVWGQKVVEIVEKNS